MEQGWSQYVSNILIRQNINVIYIIEEYKKAVLLRL